MVELQLHRRCLSEGNVRAKATDNAEHPNSSLSQPKKRLIQHLGSPIVNTDLTGKATTKTPVDVSSDPNTRIELLDKDNHVIGSGTTGANGHVIITPTQPIPEGNVTAKLTIMQNTQMSQLLNLKSD